MLKAKEGLRSRTAKVSGRRKKIVSFDLSSCFGDDVSLNAKRVKRS